MGDHFAFETRTMKVLQLAIAVTLLVIGYLTCKSSAEPGLKWFLKNAFGNNPRGGQCTRARDCGSPRRWDCNWGYCARANNRPRRRQYGGYCDTFRDCPFSQPCIGKRCYCNSPSLPC